MGNSNHKSIEFTLQSSQLTFVIDMIFRQHMKINWQMLKMQCRHQAITDNDKENQTRIPHTYQMGDKVLTVQKKNECKMKAKLSLPTEGPFTIVQIYSNGNVHINRGVYEEDIFIRRLRPYYDHA